MSKSNNINASTTQETSKTLYKSVFLNTIVIFFNSSSNISLVLLLRVVTQLWLSQDSKCGSPKTWNLKKTGYSNLRSQKRGICLKSVSRHLKMKGDYRDSRVLSSPISKENRLLFIFLTIRNLLYILHLLSKSNWNTAFRSLQEIL